MADVHELRQMARNVGEALWSVIQDESAYKVPDNEAWIMDAEGDIIVIAPQREYRISGGQKEVARAGAQNLCDLLNALDT